MGGSAKKEKNDDSRVVVFLVDHVDLRPCCKFHVIVRALQPYEMLSMHDPFYGRAEAFCV